MRHGRMRIGSGAIVLTFLLLGCSPAEKSATPNVSSAPRVRSPRELEGSIGRVVDVEGVAANAKAGAAVVLDDQSPVYLEGRNAWPAEVVTKRVRVTGTVVKHEGLHDPRASGIQEDYFTLRSASWSTVPGGK